ncbi:MAG: hypothetical protein ACK2T3_05005 [Candidatus Promineifilaceae bacterium]
MDEIGERLHELVARVRAYLETEEARQRLERFSLDHRAAAIFLLVLALLLSISFFRRSAPESSTESAALTADAGTAQASAAGTRPPSSSTSMTATAEARLGGRPIWSYTGSVSEGEASRDLQSYVPILPGGEVPTRTPLPTPLQIQPTTPGPTPIPILDFEAIKKRLSENGQDLGFVKIGFHTGAGGNRTGLGEWMRYLDSAGVPFFLKAADDAGPLYEAQQIVRESDVPHTLVFRKTGDAYDTPNYDLPPREAARQHWELHKAAFPAELDPKLVWIETINEVDKERSEWLGYFATETARLAMEDGYRWAAFGWSSGEPEMTDWTTHSMLEFLRLAGEHPDDIAIALHEYSYLAGDIGHEYPFKMGRFQLLFEITDLYEIPRPTVLITEWGWEYGDIPGVEDALRDIRWAAEMYAQYPEVKGAALWYLGDGYRGIADKAQRLIVPLTAYSVGSYFAIPLPPDTAPIERDRFRPQ